MGDNTQLQLFRVYKTCWEMLHSRNYMVGADKLTMTFDAFENEFGTGDAVRDSLTIVAARSGDSQDQVRCPIPQPKSLVQNPQHE